MGNTSVRVLFFLLFFSLPSLVGAETVKVAGSESELFLMNELAKAYMEKYREDRIEVRQDSIGAKGAFMGTSKGAIDIGLSARRLLESEKSLGLELIEIARIATVVGVNAETVPVEEIKSRQLCDIYSGKIRNWSELGGPNASIKPLTMPEPDCAKVSVREGFPCFTKLKESSDVVLMPKLDSMNAAIAGNPNTIGFTDVMAIENSKGKIRALKIDGVSASRETVASGKWQMVRHCYLVLGKKRNEAISRFIEFIRSPAGEAILKKHKAVPVP